MSQNDDTTNQQSTFLTANNIDIIGEVSNISMGSAATALSNIIGKKVTITSPLVEIGTQQTIDNIQTVPSIGVIISYTEGLIGKNLLVLREADAIKIVKVLMGDAVSDDEEFGEMHISAISEVMNQMMGSSVTALAGFIGKSVNISPPSAFKITEDNKKEKLSFIYDNITESALVKFLFSIEDMFESEIFIIMSKEFSLELVNVMMKNMGIDFLSELQDIPVQSFPEPELPAPSPVQPTPIRETQYEKANEGQAALDVQPARQVAAASQYAVQTPVRPAILPNFEPQQLSTNEFNANFELIQDVPLELSVEVGRAKKRVREVVDFSVGSIIELDKQAGDPVDIIVNGQLIAYGEVVVIDENFGVRVTEIISKKNR
jgi:flagellar motor switch protein FliN/FliY